MHGPCRLGPLVTLIDPWLILGVHELLVQTYKILSKSFPPPPPSPYYSILGARLAKLARAQKLANFAPELSCLKDDVF